MKTLKKVCIKSKTNDGYLAKQYFTIYETDIHEPTLLINKYVLVPEDGDIRTYFSYHSCHNIVKKYKGYILLRRTFGLKLSTLKQAIELLEL